MILLRPIDPAEPIVIHNAQATELEDPPEAWWADNVAYAIESTAVELPDA